MAHNRYSGQHAYCRVCGFYWSSTYEEAQKTDCSRCEEMVKKHPDVVEWVIAVVQEMMEKHTGDYYHNYR